MEQSPAPSVFVTRENICTLLVQKTNLVEHFVIAENVLCVRPVSIACNVAITMQAYALIVPKESTRQTTVQIPVLRAAVAKQVITM